MRSCEKLHLCRLDRFDVFALIGHVLRRAEHPYRLAVVANLDFAALEHVAGHRVMNHAIDEPTNARPN